MTARPLAPTVSVEARRAIWAKIWADALLRPPQPEAEPPADDAPPPSPDDEEPPRAAGAAA